MTYKKDRTTARYYIKSIEPTLCFALTTDKTQKNSETEFETEPIEAIFYSMNSMMEREEVEPEVKEEEEEEERQRD